VEEGEHQQERGKGADEDEEDATQDETGNEGEAGLEPALDLVPGAAGAVLDGPESGKVKW